MPRSDRSKLAKVVGLTIAIVLTVIASAVIIGWGLGQQTEYERQADQNGKIQAAHTADYIRYRCAALSALDKIDCAAKAKQEYQTYEHDQIDLVAQKTSALWTFLMGCAAIIGMLLSAVGVFLVWTTFRATQDANDIARDTAYRELRAYMGPGEAWLDLSLKDGLTMANVEGFLVNVGQTPAVLTDLRTIIKFGQKSGGGETHETNFIITPNCQYQLLLNGLGWGAAAAEIGPIRARVGCLFTYTDYTGREWTEVVWWITQIIEPGFLGKVELIPNVHTPGPSEELMWIEEEFERDNRIALAERGLTPHTTNDDSQHRHKG